MPHHTTQNQTVFNQNLGVKLPKCYLAAMFQKRWLKNPIALLFLVFLMTTKTYADFSCGSTCRINPYGYGLYWYQVGYGNAVDHYFSVRVQNQEQAKLLLESACQKKAATLGISVFSERIHSALMGDLFCADIHEDDERQWHCRAECKIERNFSNVTLRASQPSQAEAWEEIYRTCEKLAHTHRTYQFSVVGDFEAGCLLSTPLLEIVIQ